MYVPGKRKQILLFYHGYGFCSDALCRLFEVERAGDRDDENVIKSLVGHRDERFERPFRRVADRFGDVLADRRFGIVFPGLIRDLMRVEQAQSVGFFFFRKDTFFQTTYPPLTESVCPVI